MLEGYAGFRADDPGFQNGLDDMDCSMLEPKMNPFFSKKSPNLLLLGISQHDG